MYGNVSLVIFMCQGLRSYCLLFCTEGMARLEEIAGLSPVVSCLLTVANTAPAVTPERGKALVMAWG